MSWLQLIVKFISGNIAKILCEIISCVKSFFEYKKESELNKKKERETKEDIELIKKANDIVDNGSYNDLINLKG